MATSLARRRRQFLPVSPSSAICTKLDVICCNCCFRIRLLVVLFDVVVVVVVVVVAVVGLSQARPSVNSKALVLASVIQQQHLRITSPSHNAQHIPNHQTQSSNYERNFRDLILFEGWESLHIELAPELALHRYRDLNHYAYAYLSVQLPSSSAVYRPFFLYDECVYLHCSQCKRYILVTIEIGSIAI